jgi:hypothetical protein
MGRLGGRPSLVYRLLNPLGFVAFKMGRRQGGPSWTGGRGRIPLHFLLPDTLGL